METLISRSLRFYFFVRYLIFAVNNIAHPGDTGIILITNFKNYYANARIL